MKKNSSDESIERRNSINTRSNMKRSRRRNSNDGKNQAQRNEDETSTPLLLIFDSLNVKRTRLKLERILRISQIYRRKYLK